MARPLSRPHIYAPWHPSSPNPPTLMARIRCSLFSHDFTLARHRFPHSFLLCRSCSLYLPVQYLPISTPAVTLPEQRRAQQH
jgi:hypothetical protein